MRFDDACALLGALLDGDARKQIVTGTAEGAPDLRSALTRLAAAMREHAFAVRMRSFQLSELAGGPETGSDAPYLAVLDRIADIRGSEPPAPAVLAMLFDYYLLHALLRLSLHVWDNGNANENLAKLTGLLHRLQGPNGGGQPFAADADTLFVIASSDQMSDRRASDALLARVRTLSLFHQTRVGLAVATTLGCRLRFEPVSRLRGLASRRQEQATPYSWLSFALFAVMREYSRMHEEGIPGPERERVVEALLGGLSTDAAHFITRPVRHASADDAERLEFSALFAKYRSGLIDEFERLRPAELRYSPLALSCGAPQHLIQAVVFDAVRWNQPWPWTLNDLMTSMSSAEGTSRSKETLVSRLMQNAGETPGTVPEVRYDSAAGRSAFAVVMKAAK